jgi:RimJ/RimL family protein N-acetyltransferase
VLPGSRRSGIGCEAIDLLVGWAQGEFGLHQIELHTLPENVPMQRLAEASSFVREGVLRDYAFERGGLRRQRGLRPGITAGADRASTPIAQSKCGDMHIRGR